MKKTLIPIIALSALGNFGCSGSQDPEELVPAEKRASSLPKNVSEHAPSEMSTNTASASESLGTSGAPAQAADK